MHNLGNYIIFLDHITTTFRSNNESVAFLMTSLIFYGLDNLKILIYQMHVRKVSEKKGISSAYEFVAT